VDIGMTLIKGLVIIFVVRFFILNIKRLEGHNIFPQSKLMSWTLALLLLYIGMMQISDLLLKGGRGIRIYIEVILYLYTAYRLIHDSLGQFVIKVENIHKSQLENILKEAFNKRKLEIVKEECDEDKTTFSFLDQYVKSRIHINSSPVSTRRHSLIIEHKNDILNLEEILEDMDTMIAPIDRGTILIKLLLKVVFFAYITWNIIQIFN